MNWPALEAERRPVELVVGDEPRVLLAARAVERDAEDGRVRCARAAAPAAGRRTAAPRVSPRAGHESVYRVVNASYMSPLYRRKDGVPERQRRAAEYWISEKTS